MYNVLQKIGYQEIVPSTFQVCLLSPLKWAACKMFRNVRYNSVETFNDSEYGEFVRLNTFCEDQAALSQAFSSGFLGGGVRNIRVLNWRYFEIPHRRYHVFARRCGTETVALFVLRLEGTTAYLVDICWREQIHDEPARMIKFAKSLARKMGAVKMIFWGTLSVLRKELWKQSFIDRNASPRFSFYSADKSFNSIKWSSLHFVHGDGDTEYL